MEYTQEQDLDFSYNQSRMGYTRIFRKVSYTISSCIFKLFIFKYFVDWYIFGLYLGHFKFVLSHIIGMHPQVIDCILYTML
jgi:hypothetical protein